MKANYHTHTYRCRHAEGSDQQYVEAAIDAGLQLLGFSDHMPVPHSSFTYDRMSLEEFDEYLLSIATLKEEYSDKIEILTALECEWLEDNQDFLYQLSKRCDYMIFGNHIRLSEKVEYDYTFYANDQALELYCKESRAALSSGLFRYFAHPDYFMFGRRSFNEACRQAAHYIGQMAVELDIPLEININGFARSHYIAGKWLAPYPYPEFWQIIAQYPVKVIYGLDAHRPLHMFRADMIASINEHLGNLDFQIIDKL